jgi:hypothetical protein
MPFFMSRSSPLCVVPNLMLIERVDWDSPNFNFVEIDKNWDCPDLLFLFLMENQASKS